mgnify:CR=1 FL=1
MIIKLHEEKKVLRTVENRPALAKYLFELSQTVASGECVQPPYAIMVDFVNTDEPEILWTGGLTIEEMEEVVYALRDKINAIRFGKPLRESTVKRVRRNKEENRLAVERYQDEHPWLCEWSGCRRRFKTERGAKRHEARCIYNEGRRHGRI